MNRQIVIGVMGPGDNASDYDCKIAHQVGKYIALQGYTLLTGGRNAGVMEAALQGAKEQGGVTIGILPDDNMDRMSKFVDYPIITGMGNARNAINVLSSNVVVSIGQGAGTFSEIALAIKLNKPVIAINLKQHSADSFDDIAANSFISIPEFDINVFGTCFEKFVNNAKDINV